MRITVIIESIQKSVESERCALCTAIVYRVGVRGRLWGGRGEVRGSQGDAMGRSGGKLSHPLVYHAALWRNRFEKNQE